MVRLRPTLGKMRHHLIVGAIDSVLVIKCPSQADYGSFGSWLCKNAPTLNCDRMNFPQSRFQVPWMAMARSTVRRFPRTFGISACYLEFEASASFSACLASFS
jgi:hypothetical protein